MYSYLPQLQGQDQEKLLEPLQFLPPTKTRESDPTIRLTHIETLLLLCHTRWGRDYLRQHGVYEIVRAAHMAETVDKVPISFLTCFDHVLIKDNEQISEHIERLVQLIQGEEPKIAEAEEFDELDQTDVGPPPAPSASVDEDDEDFKIEEI